MSNPLKTTEQTPRKRQRKLDVTEQKPEEKLKTLARTAFLQNKAMNAAKREYESARKSLYSGMKELTLSTLDVETTDADGKPLHLVAEIETPTGQAVDVKKLAKLVPLDKLLEMVTVSQKAIEDTVGKAILNQVLVPTTGTENVKIKLFGK